ncbi:hypothetical protein EYZ11_006549 [Aspergillus tanneri]|uniref:Uncharacterized protein n=1 Tax=Aspergillus tanneri TaxID=1220188 RepID=A0A4S3JFI3_9EURO|nr:hypothetical protein EYZ11_006549 [Aspergillus tanneri]
MELSASQRVSRDCYEWAEIGKVGPETVANRYMRRVDLASWAEHGRIVKEVSSVRLEASEAVSEIDL